MCHGQRASNKAAIYRFRVMLALRLKLSSWFHIRVERRERQCEAILVHTPYTAGLLMANYSSSIQIKHILWLLHSDQCYGCFPGCSVLSISESMWVCCSAAGRPDTEEKHHYYFWMLISRELCGVFWVWSLGSSPAAAISSDHSDIPHMTFFFSVSERLIFLSGN